MRYFSALILLSSTLVSAPAWAQDAPVSAKMSSLPACDTALSEHCYDAVLDLYRGHSGTQDKAAAHDMFAELCDGGMGKACHAAAMYVSRYSENPDFEQSLHFQSKGCDEGLAQSCHVMGRNYEAPWETDIEADPEKAKAYFVRACDLGFNLSCGYAKMASAG